MRGAFLLALVWGKILAGVFYILHIDIPVFTVYRYYRGYGYYPVFTVTANMLVFLSFLVTALLPLAWPPTGEGARHQGPRPTRPSKEEKELRSRWY